MKRVILSLFWCAISFFGSGFVVGVVVSFFPFIDLNQPIWQAVVNIVVYLLTILLVIIIPGKIRSAWQVKRTDLGLSGLPTWLDILLGIAGFVVAMLLAYLLNQLFLLFPWYQAIADQAQDVGFNYLATQTDRIIAFVSLVILAPIAEEIIFRGWLYGKLRTGLPVVPAVVLVSLAFAAMHGQWNVALTTFMLSAVLCAQREITGTIYAGTIVHMINNAVAFYAMFIV